MATALPSSSATPAAAGGGEGAWSCVEVGPPPPQKVPTDALDLVDASVQALLPKAPQGDGSTPLVQIVRDATQDHVDMENHLKRLLNAGKQLERYFMSLRAGGSSAQIDDQFQEGVQRRPTLTELRQEVAELENELREKDALIERSQQDVERWLGELEKLPPFEP